MRRKLFALGLTALLTLTGSMTASAEPISAPSLPPPATSITEGNLKLEATAEKRVAPGEQVTVVVTASNTGPAPLAFWLPTPCHSPFAVAMEAISVPRIQAVTTPEPPDGVQISCPQVVQKIDLEPGGSIKQAFILETKGLSPGGYTIAATFAAWSGEEQLTSVQVKLNLLVDGFTDIIGHWAAELVRDGIQLGFIDGYPDGRFQPQNQVTRAELVAMLIRARELERRTMDLPYFLDTAGHWSDQLGYLQPAIESALLDPAAMLYALKPDEPLTRQETAILAVRAMGHAVIPPTEMPVKLHFRDSELIDPSALPYIEIAAESEILTGYEDLTFRPDLPVTRAEAVTMVLRMLRAALLQVDSSVTLLVDGEPVAAPGIASRKMAPAHLLVPVGAVAGATGIRVTVLDHAWIRLERGAESLKLKISVPYASVAGGQRLYFDGLTPAAIDGQLYVPAAALEALGLGTGYDPDARQFSISTQK